ncbi:MAG: spermidine/putrescine ABC transporter substrate-binding protein [Acidobacteria bacterium]|nr:spermidine/putrescine ABC transporter substrate-binding protein [Acidobacteriota bacterium]
MMKKILLPMMGSLVSVLVCSLCGCGWFGLTRSQLTLCNWPAFIGAGAVPAFEKRHSTSVLLKTYSGNEELYQMLTSGSVQCDLVVPSTYMVERLIRERLLEPLDLKRIPNLKNISDRFLNLPIDPGNRFSVPYMWGSNGLGVNTVRVSKDPGNLDLLFDPELKGRITMLDVPRFSIGLALQYLGYSLNTTRVEEIEKAKELLIRQKPLVRDYTDAFVDLLNSEISWVSYGYSGDLCRAAAKNPALTYRVPKQAVLFGLDSLCIPAAAKNKELAHTFISYLLEPRVSAEIANEILYPTPNEAAYPFVDPKLLNNREIYLPDEVLQKAEMLRDLGKAGELYEKAWKEVRSSNMSRSE